jgi:hypothetical protein
MASHLQLFLTALMILNILLLIYTLQVYSITESAEIVLLLPFYAQDSNYK